MPLEYLAIELQVQRYRYADCLFMFLLLMSNILSISLYLFMPSEVFVLIYLSITEI